MVSNVFRKFSFQSKSLLAYIARKWLLTCVNRIVYLKLCLVDECLLADGTRKWPDTRVCLFVLDEIKLFIKTLSTLFAAEGPFRTSVNSVVLREMILTAEILPAHGARKRLFARVNFFMIGKNGLPRERLATEGAEEWPLTRVESVMCLKTFILFEGLPT